MNIYIATDSPREPFVQSVIDHLQLKSHNVTIYDSEVGVYKPESCNLRNLTIPTVTERAREDKSLIDNSDLVMIIFPYVGKPDIMKAFYALGSGIPSVALCDFNFQDKVKNPEKYLVPNWICNLTKILWTIREIDPYLESLENNV